MDIILATLKPFLEDRREDDAFDRLNYKATPLVLLLCATINTAKLYTGNIIDCFTKAEFANGWIEYTKDYCFVENTYYLNENDSDDTSFDFRSQRYISYYQWAPFILGLQALSLYVPHMIFRSFNWITGYHVYSVVTNAAENRMENEEKRTKAINEVAKVLYQAKQNHHQMFCFETQRFVTYLYFGMKFFYLILICIHMFIYKIFIGNLTYAIDILNSGIEWRSSGLFPRVTVCDMQILRFGAPINYTMECVLPMNMFNEKIFLFLYFWMILLFTLNVWSIYIWFDRMFKRHTFFTQLLLNFTKNQTNWREGVVKTPDDSTSPESNNIASGSKFNSATLPLIPDNSDKNGITKENIDYEWDMRLVLGLLKEHVGLFFTSAIFKQINLLREKDKIQPKVNVQNNRKRNNVSLSSSES